MSGFADFLNQFDYLKQQIDYFVYGKSYLGQDLIAFHKGSYNTQQLIITGGIHAREYISVQVVIDLLKSYNKNIGCYFLPMLNPDGVRLVVDGVFWIKDKNYRNYLINLNNNKYDFSLWKANARGVDLNVNFDAMWGAGKYIKNYPCASGYIGEYPISEIENKNFLNFVTNKQIFASISYHSKGEVVYYGFEKLNKKQLNIAKNTAKNISKLLNYSYLQSKNSSGGLSDYLSYCCNIPSFTIELGSDKYTHPIQLNFIKEVEKNQSKVLDYLIKKFGEK
ncbi:MAG: hypothetical protein J6Q51_04070 [Clostridia bacterium]|nr:hypothetical protein [Clostridia bacterium]